MSNNDLLTITKLLQKLAEEQNFVNYELIIEPISSGGANYTSSLYNVTVLEGKKTHYMFVKVAAMGEKARAQVPKFYETEIFVYTKLLKVYQTLENEHQMPHNNRLLLPKFYGCDPTLYEETVVLENLAVQGFQAYDRFKSFDWTYASSAMIEISKMHALSFAYRHYYPEEFKNVVDILKYTYNIDDDLSVYFDMAFTKAIGMVHEETKDKMKRFCETIDKEKFSQLYMEARCPVLMHGDFKPSNLMHRPRSDGSLEIKVVDLQTLQGASPVIDLLYFIFTGSDEKFRAEYYEKLLDYYYEELQMAMKRLHLEPDNIYSREDFSKDLEEKLPFGLTIAVFALPVVTVAEEHAPKVNGDLDLSSFSVENTSELFTERLNGVVNDFVKWGILK